MHGDRVCVVKGDMHSKGACMVRGDMHGRGAYVAGETATAADGTHPTGMHSCYKAFCVSFSITLIHYYGQTERT